LMSTVARVDRLPGGDDGAVALVVIVVAEARRAEPPTLLYAALRGSCALGLASSSLRPTSRSDTDEHGSPSKTNPATTGTDIATPASCETRTDYLKAVRQGKAPRDEAPRDATKSTKRTLVLLTDDCAAAEVVGSRSHSISPRSSGMRSTRPRAGRWVFVSLRRFAVGRRV